MSKAAKVQQLREVYLVTFTCNECEYPSRDIHGTFHSRAEALEAIREAQRAKVQLTSVEYHVIRFARAKAQS